MSFAISIEDASGSLVVSATGHVGEEDAFELIERLVSDPEIPDGINGLVDLRSVDRLDLSAEAIQRASETAAEYESCFAGSRWGIVAGKDLAFGISRMYELQRNPQRYTIGVFRDMEAARAWLAEPTRGTTPQPGP